MFQGLESTDATATRETMELLKIFSFLSYEDIRTNFLMASVAHPRPKEKHDQKEAAREARDKSAAQRSSEQPKVQLS